MPSSLRLSPAYSLIAILVAAVALIAGWLYLGRIAWWPSAALAIILSWLAMIDIDRFKLPDPLTLGLLSLGMIVSIPSGWTVVAGNALGALLGFGTLALVSSLYRRWRRIDGLGGGDAKLLGAGGAWIGWAALPHAVLIGSLCGLTYVVAARLLNGPREPNAKIAFGPFLALGVWVAWVASLTT